MITRRPVLVSALASTLLPRPALAQTRPKIRLGVLSSFSGEYADGAGEGSVIATRLAAEDAGADVEILQADMQDKPDIGAAIARAWFDRDGVHAIVDVPNSSVALAVATIARERNKAALFSGPGLAVLSGAQCSPNHLQWTYDTTALANGTARALLAEGARTWFFITADYSFGHGLQAATTRVVEAAGGSVLGAAPFPFPNTADFSAFLLEARASGADTIGLACTGNNFITLVKQAAEFRIVPAQRLAALICLITNIHAIGLPQAQGLVLTSPFYWDLNDATRAFTARFTARFHQPPTMVQAGAYSAVTHYLKCAVDPTDGAATIARMKATPAIDPLFGPSTIRANGSVAHDMHLFQVKSPAESRHPWDYYRLLRTIPAAQAFSPPAESGCTL